MMLIAPYLLESFCPVYSPRLPFQFTDSLATETPLSEVRVREFFLPVFHGGQVRTRSLALLLPHFILSARGVCRVSGRTTAMTDKPKVTSWSQAQLSLISASQEMAPNSVHRSMHSIIMTFHEILTCDNMKYVVSESLMDLSRQRW